MDIKAVKPKISYLSLIVITVFFIFTETISASVVNNPFYHRIINGKTNRDVIVIERIMEKESPYFYSKLSIPVLHSITENELFKQLNKMFYDGITFFSHEIESLSETHLEELLETRDFIPRYDAIVGFEVPFNAGGLLSIKVYFYQYTGGAHGFSFIETVNLDLTTGRSIEFNDLFDSAQARKFLIDTIQTAINQDPFNYFITEVDESILSRIQSFYITEGKIVVYFDLYEIAPYSTGIPEFSLDLTKLIE